jgi:hypothetical protein
MRGCRVETRRLGSVSQDTGRPRSDLGRAPPGRTMASRYSAPANCREHVIPVRQAKGAKPDLQKDQHPVSATTRTRLHLLSRKPTFQEVQISPAKSNPSTWRGTSRPNPASIKNQKNTLIRSDTTDPVHLLWNILISEPGKTSASIIFVPFSFLTQIP